MNLRNRLLQADSCSFETQITADYEDSIFTFAMCCTGDKQGTIEFTVTEPVSIAGISGTLAQEKGNLTFAETALEFPLLADEQVSPISAPWIFLKTLQGGYLTSAGTDGELVRLSIDDSFADNALHLEIWLNQEDVPVRSEILYQNRKIVSMDVRDFRIE